MLVRGRKQEWLVRKIKILAVGIQYRRGKKTPNKSYRIAGGLEFVVF